VVIDWEHDIPPIKETTMFTVLSKTRTSNLFLIGALAIAVVTLLTFAVVPGLSAPRSVPAPISRLSEAGSDYYERHPELSAPVEMTGDWYQKYPGEWASRGAGVAIPVTGSSAASDYFQRHPELSSSANVPLDECVDVSIGELAACRGAVQTPILTPGMACESPVDCR
jgi:hypothetical protein